MYKPFINGYGFLEEALNKRIVFFLAFFLFNGGLAAAGDLTPYIGVGGGVFGAKYAEQGVLGGLELSKTTWGGFIKAGVDFQQYMGLELRTGISGAVSTVLPAGTIGSIRPIGLEIQTTNFISYLAKAQFPVTRKFRIYGLLGGTAGRFQIASAGGLRGAVTTWKSAFSYGGGAEYKFRSKGSIGVEWVQYWRNVPLSIVSNATSKASLYGASVMVNKFF